MSATSVPNRFNSSGYNYTGVAS